MSDSLLFTDEFKKKHGDTIGLIESGPTADELVRGRAKVDSQLGLSSGREPVPSNWWQRLQRRGQSEVELNEAQADALRQGILESRAQIKAQNLAAAAEGLQFIAGLAKSVAAIRDPSKREVVRNQTESAVANGAPNMVGLYNALVENDALLALDREQYLATVLKSPTAQRIYSANNGDMTPLLESSELMQQAFDEVNKVIARDSLKSSKATFNRLKSEFARRNPARSEEILSDSDMSMAEATEIIMSFEDEDPDINDPSKRKLLFNAIEQFSEAFGVTPDAELAKEREELRKQRAQALYSDPENLDVSNYITPSGEQLLGKTDEQGVWLQDDNGAFNVKAPKGTRKVGMQVTGTPDQMIPGADKSVVAGMDVSENLTGYIDALRKLEEGGPGIVGVRGLLNTRVSGYLAQLDQGLGEGLANFIAQRPDALQITQDFQQRAQAIVGQAVKELRIEESGRITEMEREIAARAVALTQPGKSFKEVQQGLQTLIQLGIVAQDAAIIRAGGTPQPIETDQDLLAMRNEFLGMGLTNAQAADTTRSIKTMRSQLAKILGSLQGQQ